MPDATNYIEDDRAYLVLERSEGKIETGDVEFSDRVTPNAVLSANRGQTVYGEQLMALDVGESYDLGSGLESDIRINDPWMPEVQAQLEVKEEGVKYQLSEESDITSALVNVDIRGIEQSIPEGQEDAVIMRETDVIQVATNTNWFLKPQ